MLPFRDLKKSFTDPYVRAVSLLTVAVYLFTLSWSLSMPFFDGPDEVRHYNSVARLVDGGGWPRPYEAELLPSVRQAYYESDLNRISVMGTVRLDLPAPSDRSTLLGESQVEAGSRDYMVQHPPGYYAVIAIAYAAVEGDGLRWDRALLLMRVISATIFAASVPFIVGSVRRMTGSRIAGLVGTSSLVSIPFFTNAGAYVSNDSLLTLSLAVATYCLVRFGSSPQASRGWQIGAGVAVGVALLTKGFALMFLPAVVLLSLLAVHRRSEWRVWRGLITVSLPLVIGAAAGGWWWVRNVVVLGVLQPSQYARGTHAYPMTGEYEGVWVFATNAWHRIAATFWGRGSYSAIAFPDWLTSAASVGALVLLVAAALWARRRADLIGLATYSLLVMGTTLMNAHAIYVDIGDPDRGVQGRYLFSGITVLAIAVGVVFVGLWRRLGRAAGIGVAIALWAPWAIGFLGQDLIRRRTWGVRSGTLETAETTVGGWMAMSPSVATTLSLAAITLVVLLVAVAPAVTRTEVLQGEAKG